MEISSLGVRTGVALHALAGAEIEDRGTHLVIRTPRNPTFRWGNFYLLARPPAQDEVQDLLTAYDADFPHTKHRSFEVDGTEDQSRALCPLVTAGLGIEVSTVLTASSVRPPSRPNVEAGLRQLTTDGDWEQRVNVSVAVNSDEDPPRWSPSLLVKPPTTGPWSRPGTEPGGVRSSGIGS